MWMPLSAVLRRRQSAGLPGHSVLHWKETLFIEPKFLGRKRLASETCKFPQSTLQILKIEQCCVWSALHRGPASH